MYVCGYLLDDVRAREASGYMNDERPSWADFGTTAMIMFVPDFTGVCKVTLSADIAASECIYVYEATRGVSHWITTLKDEGSDGWCMTTFYVAMEAGCPFGLLLEQGGDGCNFDGVHFFGMNITPDGQDATFKVALDPAGGSLGTSTLTRVVDQPFGALPIPQRGGHVFKGWYFTDKQGCRHHVISETIAHSYINALKARWEEIGQESFR